MSSLIQKHYNLSDVELSQLVVFTQKKTAVWYLRRIQFFLLKHQHKLVLWTGYVFIKFMINTLKFQFERNYFLEKIPWASTME